jgi:hypothetical protein
VKTLISATPIFEMSAYIGALETGRSPEISMSEPAKVFEDRLYPGTWRVESEDDDGGLGEVTIFGDPDAGDRAF